jgi:hypothetical protein
MHVLWGLPRQSGRRRRDARVPFRWPHASEEVRHLRRFLPQERIRHVGGQ